MKIYWFKLIKLKEFVKESDSFDFLALYA